MPKKVNRIPGIKSTASGKWQARVYHAGGEESKNFARQEDARLWQMGLKRDLERCPTEITRERRLWNVSLVTPSGVISKSFSELDRTIEWLNDGKDQIRKGSWVDPERIGETLKEFSDKWLQERVEVSGKTLATYISQLKVHILPKFGRYSLTSIGQADVRSWVSALQESGVGTTTMRQSLRLLRAIMEDALDSGLCVQNPTKGIRVAKQTKKRPKALTPEQVRSLAKACGKYGSLVEFLSGTGLRINEALALKVGDVDKENSRLLVSRTWTSTESGKKVLGDTKGREERSIHLSGPMLELLGPWLSSKSGDDFLFTGDGGGALDYGHFRRAYFVPAAVKLGVDGVTIHWLRHTCASMLIRLGAPITTISEILGHSSITITLDTYSHWFEGDSSNWLNKLGEKFL